MSGIEGPNSPGYSFGIEEYENQLLDNYFNNFYGSLECQNNPYSQMNECEREMAVDHPICAVQLAANWITANHFTRMRFGYNEANDCSDAFRHAFFNALNMFSCGEDVAQEFGSAHECESESNMATEMDFHNNHEGYQVLLDNPDILLMMNTDDATLQHQAIKDLGDKICARMSSGNLLIFMDPGSEDPDNDPSNFLIDSNNCQCLEY